MADVDLQVADGELMGLLGPNGAGKTTLISILCTMVQPTSGDATVCGYDVRRDQTAVRRSVGVVFQDSTLDEDLTGQENLNFHARLYGLNAATRRERVNTVLELVALSKRRGDLVKTYSGGMRRRLEIAKGLMHNPKVLFLDEPTLGLDPQARRRIWDHISKLRDACGTTVVLTTHYMEEAEFLCSRVAIIDRGRIVAIDDVEVLKANFGQDRVELRVLGKPDPLLHEINQLNDVLHCSVQNGRLHLTVRSGDSFVPKVMELARSCKLEISSLSVRKSSLEDVFMNLTGRETGEDLFSSE